jgi:hypothetical protein
MITVTDSPFLVLGISLLALCLGTWAGAEVLGRYAPTHEVLEDFRIVLAACLTLLGLLIGFSFSMAISRYDLRKSYEAAEASAIGTAYLRVDFLPPADAYKTRQLLRDYLAQRIVFFTNRDSARLRELSARTTQLQRQLWSTVRASASAQPGVLTALAASGTNEVINSEGNTQASWWNRIPTAAWALMAVIAILCNIMVGFSARHLKGRSSLYVLPPAVSIAFFLIADIDSPSGGGLIHITPQDLLSLSESMR